MRSGSLPFAIGLFLFSPSLVCAQGRTDYFNVESPQVKPITIARLSGHDYLLVCNTPDNSVEIWDTNEALTLQQRFKGRVRVGLEPVSVKFNPTFSLAYTANFLGDSISVFALTIDAGNVKVTPSMTRDVGDEPMDVAISPNGLQLYVTHSMLGTYGRRDSRSLLPVDPLVPQIDLVEGTTSLRGIKEPRTVAISGGKLFVLGFKGGSDPLVYDFDVYVRDIATDAVSAISGLGSTNFNMTFSGGGDLWVVGGEAQNGDATETDVANEPTGFVRSTIYVVPGATGTPIRRDLNDVDGGQNPVGPDDALAQPTDVITYEPAGGPLKVYFTAFGSDRIGVLTPNLLNDPYTWPLVRIPVSVAPLSTNPMAGPRGLAVKYAITGDGTDPGDRVYVMNRLDNSVTTIRASDDFNLGTFALKNDPTPAHIRAGRKFLYSAKISQPGFVSCASCHMDGRTDSLVWKLGTPTVPPPPYPAGLADGLNPPPTGTFKADKGEMVTQSLQGLLNYEVEPAIQGYFTNAPYHWRGDKAQFTDFNVAFVNLMKALPNAQGNGISDTEMLAYRDFVDSIHYPPNPHEPETRVFSGDFGTPDVDTDGDGDGAARGLKMFHIHPIPAICHGKSCVQCHFLPESSNNRGTVPSNDIIETAATRGLFQREMRLDKTAGPVSDVVTGEFGLAHLGATLSLNSFVNRFHAEFTDDGLLAVKGFMREFDFGTAPLVGRAYTVNSTNKDLLETTTALDLVESQAALGNVGVAVHGRIGPVDTGYWLDLTHSPLAYRIEDLSGFKTRAELLALVASTRDRLVFTATPLGSERRVASVSGTVATLTGSAPSGIELQPAAANTAYVQIPSLTKNWDPFDPNPSAAFHWTGPAVSHSVKALRLMQHGLMGFYGLNTMRHEAPRRFVVAGNDIRQGAVLRLFVPNDAVAPDHTGPLNQISTVEFALPIYPTGQTLPDGRRVWQTAVEADAALLYTMMLGGWLAPGMSVVLDPAQVIMANEPLSPNPFDPANRNWHYVKVKNPDGQEGDGGWQHLTLQ